MEQPTGSPEVPVVRVIEWVPGAFWVVEDRGPSRGFWPLAGPFATRAAAASVLPD